ncbi:hypothetical protein CsatB_010067 [Cannabis sativa]
MPNAWRLLLGIEVIVRVKGKRVDFVDFKSSYYLKQHDTDKGRYRLILRANKKAWVTELVASNKRGWRKKYCFVKGDLFGMSDYVVPTSWRTLSKGLTRCPRRGCWSEAQVNDLLSIPSDHSAHKKLLILNKSCVGKLWRAAQRQEGSIFSLNVVKRAPILLLTRALEKMMLLLGVRLIYLERGLRRPQVMLQNLEFLLRNMKLVALCC